MIIKHRLHYCLFENQDFSLLLYIYLLFYIIIYIIYYLNMLVNRFKNH